MADPRFIPATEWLGLQQGFPAPAASAPQSRSPGNSGVISTLFLVSYQSELLDQWRGKLPFTLSSFNADFFCQRQVSQMAATSATKPGAAKKTRNPTEGGNRKRLDICRWSVRLG